MAPDRAAHKHKVRFGLMLLSGSFLSAFWFAMHIIITSQHEVDSEVINNMGRLRLNMQRFGMAFIASSRALQPKASTSSSCSPLGGDIHATLAQIDGICGGLLGLEVRKCVPEIRDGYVKEALEHWMETQLDHIRLFVSRSPRSFSGEELKALMDKVDEATQAVDDVVNQASDAARSRVDLLLGISIARVILGIIWALFTGYFFGQLWLPYIATCSRLQDAEQELTSLVRAAFDVVVPVQPAAPFQVVGCQEELRHFLGRSMDGDSVLACANGPEEEHTLQEFLLRALGPAEAPPRRRPSLAWQILQHCAWFLQPGVPAPAQLPVAPMIRSRWKTGATENIEKSLNVELLMVPGSNRKQAALLAVRAVHDETDGPPSCLPDSLEQAVDAALPQVIGRRLEVNFEPLNGLFMFGSQSGGAASAPTQSSSTATAIGVLPVGTISPASEVESTPPPTTIGLPAGHAIPREHFYRTGHDYQVASLALELQNRLEQEVVSPGTPSRSRGVAHL